jgi:hypothetical protein
MSAAPAGNSISAALSAFSTRLRQKPFARDNIHDETRPFFPAAVQKH